MNYELAKKLKEAGFPMPEHSYDDDNGYCHRNCDTGLGVCFPTLSELIDACGDEFDCLMKSRMGNPWTAATFNGEKGMGGGETPEEAVANLWLELNKKR